MAWMVPRARRRARATVTRRWGAAAARASQRDSDSELAGASGRRGEKHTIDADIWNPCRHMTIQTRHMTCHLIWRVWIVICWYRISISLYDVIWRHILFIEFMTQHSTGIYMSGTVYRGIPRHMTVYCIFVKVNHDDTSIYWYSGTYWYIQVNTVYPDLFPAAPGWPAWKLRTCFSQRTPVSSSSYIKFILSSLSVPFAGGGAVGCRGWRGWGGVVVVIAAATAAAKLWQRTRWQHCWGREFRIWKSCQSALHR